MNGLRIFARSYKPLRQLGWLLALCFSLPLLAAEKPKQFRAGAANEGGEGCTVVEFT